MWHHLSLSECPGSTEFQGCFLQIIDCKCLLLRAMWQAYSTLLGFWMKFLRGHWKEEAASVRYLVVSELVRAEAMWDLGRCLACGHVLKLRLTDRVGAAGAGQGYLSRSDPAGEWWAVLASLPTGGPGRGEEPLSGPLTNRPAATGLMTSRPGLLVALDQDTFQGSGAGGPLSMASCCSKALTRLKESICLLTSKPNNVQKEFTARRLVYFKEIMPSLDSQVS